MICMKLVCVWLYAGINGLRKGEKEGRGSECGREEGIGGLGGKR